ncbi:hypothetical protein DAPPUDRAFT_240183 [Daphnia pulex]|uniref:Uncharacterized protein n=1 Tax=Daphnia pulex TaxID=6669 RepID=E9GB24_DAPPU|nr:hypothetical protein DAPPUDRAFT_240183 [Daphnia pulex]|eukprot:EFX83444.1 hypothetical protein DAPPUDRAFT_240183 [Daphnia pulex]
MRKLPQQQQQPSSSSQQPTSSVQVDQLINQQTDKVFQVVNPINTLFDKQRPLPPPPPPPITRVVQS